MVAEPKWAFGTSLNYPKFLFRCTHFGIAFPSDTAGWFWKSNGLGSIADRGDFMQLTRRINGGLTHWVKRKLLLEQAKKCIPKSSFGT
jgi:putative chitinase